MSEDSNNDLPVGSGNGSKNDSPRVGDRFLPLKLMIVCIGMLGFGYALVPLYDIICDITGLNGRNTALLEAQESGKTVVDENREITVYFTGVVNRGLSWQFRPTTNKMVVHPGQEYTTEFFALNEAGAAVTGNAAPSVSPNQAAKYFLKTECFCFTEQTLAAGERRDMPVRFVIDPELPKDIDSVVLAYTFYKTDQVAAAP